MAERRRIPSTSEAVAATLACAALLGLPADRPEVVAEGYSVRVRLHPAPVISRVVTKGLRLRGDPVPWMRREIDVATHLAATGAPVVPPWEQPGPFFAGALAVSLWTWVDQQPGVISSRELGAMLRELHTALDTFPGRLPPLIGPLTDVHAAMASCDDLTLHTAATTLVPLALSWPRRTLHGDAHTGNVLITSAGPLWTDFEDSCVGPLEWDLASRTLSDDAVTGYGRGVNLDRLRECRDLRRLQILAALLTDDLQDASLRTEIYDELSRY